MFNFSLQAQGSGYTIWFDQGDRNSAISKQTWNDFWTRVFGNN
jgi:hypothetical protein